MLIDNGIRVAVRIGTGNPALVKALQAIDALAVTVTRADDAQTGLRPILATLQSSLSADSALQTSVGNAITALGMPPDTRALEVRITHDAWLVWCLAAVISTTAGIYVLIVQNFGFGTVPDLIKCFFWGLGVSVAGTQLQQLTQPTVLGTFGISIPKT